MILILSGFSSELFISINIVNIFLILTKFLLFTLELIKGINKAILSQDFQLYFDLLRVRFKTTDIKISSQNLQALLLLHNLH